MTQAVETDFDNGTLSGIDDFYFSLLIVVLSLDLARSFFVNPNAIKQSLLLFASKGSRDFGVSAALRAVTPLA